MMLTRKSTGSFYTKQIHSRGKTHKFKLLQDNHNHTYNLFFCMFVHLALFHKMSHYTCNSKSLEYWSSTGNTLQASPHIRWYPCKLYHPLQVHNHLYTHNKSQSEYWYIYVHTDLFPLWHIHLHDSGLVHQSYHHNLSACYIHVHMECTDDHFCIWIGRQNM